MYILYSSLFRTRFYYIEIGVLNFDRLLWHRYPGRLENRKHRYRIIIIIIVIVHRRQTEVVRVPCEYKQKTNDNIIYYNNRYALPIDYIMFKRVRHRRINTVNNTVYRRLAIRRQEAVPHGATAAVVCAMLGCVCVSAEFFYFFFFILYLLGHKAYIIILCASEERRSRRRCTHRLHPRHPQHPTSIINCCIGW